MPKIRGNGEVGPRRIACDPASPAKRKGRFRARSVLVRARVVGLVVAVLVEAAAVAAVTDFHGGGVYQNLPGPCLNRKRTQKQVKKEVKAIPRPMLLPTRKDRSEARTQASDM